MKQTLIVILGPTASGKTSMAAQLAYDLGGEIISADSRQVYQGMDIGTGKDLTQYNINGKAISYHLIDIVDPKEEFNLFEFQKRFYQVLDYVLKQKRLPIMVGGTGMYLEAIIKNYQMPPVFADSELKGELDKKSMEELREILSELQPSLHNATDLLDKERIVRKIEIEQARKKQSKENLKKADIKSAVFGIHWERSVLRQRITVRLKERLMQGLIEEVDNLRKSGLSDARLDSFGLEYRFVSQYLQGSLNYDEMFTKLNTSIHQFAKRQETWFRRMERNGIVINWIEGNNYNLLKDCVVKYLQ
jgi:tRNA dimethylallyltransferase